MSKVGWQDSAEPTIGHYYIAVNRSGKAMPQGKIVDTLGNPGVVYIKDSFQIHKGIWVFRNGDWNLDNAVNITDQAKVIFENNSFSIQLPDLADYEGVGISYKVQLPSAPNDGDKFLNSATLTTSNNIEVTHNSGYTFYQGGGKAEGHVFKLQIKKVSEDGSVLKGAKFDVIRDRSGGVVAQVETDENGIAEIENLLKDNYTIKETQAPNGYELTESVHVTPADFDSTLKLATKLIVNKKITTTTTVAPTTTTTTTPATTVTTAEATTTPATTVTTAEATTTPATTVTTAEATTTPATTVTTAEATTTPATTVTTAEATTTPATTVTTAEATTTPATTVTTAEATTTPATTVTTAEATTTPATTVTTAEATTTPATTVAATTTTVEPTTTAAATTTTVAPTTSATTTAATTVNVPGTTTGVTPPPAGGKKGKSLPKTGEESSLTTSLVGFALMTVAGVAVMLYRKSKKA